MLGMPRILLPVAKTAKNVEKIRILSPQLPTYIQCVKDRKPFNPAGFEPIDSSLLEAGTLLEPPVLE
jgi:hypothetical protein